MSRALEDRLVAAKAELAKVEAVLLKHHGTGRIPADTVKQFHELAAFEADVDAWCGMIAARRAARNLLTELERQVDGDDTVLLGTSRAKYEHVRLIGVQAYLSTKWALADRLVGMAGRIVCTATTGLNTAQPAQLVTSFVNADRKKAPAASFYQSIRETFGWPIALSLVCSSQPFCTRRRAACRCELLCGGSLACSVRDFRSWLAANRGEGDVLRRHFKSPPGGGHLAERTAR